MSCGPIPAAILVLPPALRDRLAAETARAFPRECCGLIEGVRRGEEIEAIRLHPARNLAPTPDRFEIDPAEQFRLLRALRATEREVVGCYHSHPNGVARPSARDREMAGEEGFVWLIATTNPEAAGEIAAYSFENNGFRSLRLVEAPRAIGPRRGRPALA